MSKIDKNHVDVSQMFLVFMATIGDCERTAAALDVTPEVVRELAEREGWVEKVRRVSVMSKSEKPGDYERATNRALNFVQAHQLREMIEAFLRHMRGLSQEEVQEMMTTADRLGKKHVSTRFFSDVATALQKCHEMTYAALGDASGDRKLAGGSVDAEGKANTAGIHAAVIAVLNAKSPASDTPLLEEGQNGTVEVLKPRE